METGGQGGFPPPASRASPRPPCSLSLTRSASTLALCYNRPGGVRTRAGAAPLGDVERFEGSIMTSARWRGGDRSGFLLAGMTLLLACSVSCAEQFVLFDVTFTFTKEDADKSKPSKSHYYV